MIAFVTLREYLEFRDIEEEGERVFEEIIKWDHCPLQPRDIERQSGSSSRAFFVAGIFLSSRESPVVIT